MKNPHHILVQKKVNSLGKEGEMLRLRGWYEDLGEKRSTYFFNLESRNYNN